jgi:hypothetical protein
MGHARLFPRARPKIAFHSEPTDLGVQNGSAKVFSPESAVKATLALNAEAWFFCLDMGSLLSLRCAYTPVRILGSTSKITSIFIAKRNNALSERASRSRLEINPQLKRGGGCRIHGTAGLSAFSAGFF